MNFFSLLVFAAVSFAAPKAAVQPGKDFKAVPTEDGRKVCAGSLDRFVMENEKAKNLKKPDLEFITESCVARHKGAVEKCKKTIADKKVSLAKAITDKKELENQIQSSLMPEQLACLAKSEQGAADNVKALGTLYVEGKGAKAKSTVEGWKKEAK